MMLTIKILIARILEESKLIESEKILLHLTKDIDDVVRMEACNALSNSDSLEVYEALRELLQRQCGYGKRLCHSCIRRRSCRD